MIEGASGLDLLMGGGRNLLQFNVEIGDMCLPASLVRVGIFCGLMKVDFARYLNYYSLSYLNY